MTTLFYCVVTLFVCASLVAPFIDDMRRRRYDSERARARRVERDFVRRHRVDPPRFTRDQPVRRDPSPRPLGDLEWRAISEGDAQR